MHTAVQALTPLADDTTLRAKMSATVPSDAKMAVFRSAAVERWRARERLRLERRDRALDVARRGADLLRASFGARHVAMFGSLVAAPERFDAHSDVDLAVWGLDGAAYFRAVAQLLALDPSIQVDLVRIEDASESLRARIDAESKTL